MRITTLTMLNSFFIHALKRPKHAFSLLGIWMCSNLPTCNLYWYQIQGTSYNTEVFLSLLCTYRKTVVMFFFKCDSSALNGQAIASVIPPEYKRIITLASM